MKYPVISLIIPFCNSPGWDRRQMMDALLSALPKRPDLQVLLVDDHSTLPYTAPAGVTLLKAEEGMSKGAGAARNRGIMAASGTWLMFADSDDIIDTVGLVRLLDELAIGQWDGVDLLVPQVVSFQDGDPQQEGRRHQVASRWIKRAETQAKPTALVRVPAAWIRIVRREFALEHGLLFGTNRIGEDVEFAISLALKTPKTAFLGYVLPRIRDGHLSVTSAISRKGCEQALVAKLAGNFRLRANGMSRWEYPLFLDLLTLARRNPFLGVVWLVRILSNGSRLLPLAADLKTALRSRKTAYAQSIAQIFSLESDYARGTPYMLATSTTPARGETRHGAMEAFEAQSSSPS